ncbi:MAG: hypothetical protein RL755_2134, partial [Pseudomonadota bacterium]
MKTIAPIVILCVGGFVAYEFFIHRPIIEPQASIPKIPTVNVLTVSPQDYRLTIVSQGVAKARESLEITAEVAGKITALHSDFVAGGFFEKDDLLVQFDTNDYDLAIAQAKAQLFEAKRLLATEEAQAQQAQTEWKTLGSGEPTLLAMHQPQLAEARAKLSAAEVNLQRADIQRRRCELKAPFSGRFYSKSASLGQTMRIGDKLARIYSTQTTEIRLPIDLNQMAYIDLPTKRIAYRDGINVNIHTDLAGKKQQWLGKIIRTEGIIDENTGAIYAIAEVNFPYQTKPPLYDGLFVSADIEGKTLHHVFALPSRAVNASNHVFVIDANSTLHTREVNVI